MKQDWKILRGDCLDLLPRFKNQVHLVVTSPPYNAGMDYGEEDKDDKPFDECLNFLQDSLAFNEGMRSKMTIRVCEH